VTKWPVVTLSDIFEIARGGSPRPIDSYITESQDGINWIMISDASEGSKYITGTKKRIRSDGAQRSRTVQAGDFLLTNSMSFGKPYIMRTSGCIHDGWLVLSPRRRDVDADFFYHLLGSKALYSEFERRASGATVKNLNIDVVKNVAVPIPPLAQQRRIAHILDKADALRAKRRAALAQLDTLTQSTFLDMFGDPILNPRKWPMNSLGSLGTLERGVSRHRPRGAPELLGGPYPLIQTGDVANCDGYVRTFKSSYSEVGLRQSRIWPAGTLCITIAANIAKTGILTFDACFPDSVVAFRSAEIATVEFVRCYFSFVQASLELIAPESAQKNINLDILRTLRVPAPPLELQREFTSRLRAVEELRMTERTSIAHFDALFASLQHRAFRAEL
jgi:type I restriction enzyme S subunit